MQSFSIGRGRQKSDSIYEECVKNILDLEEGQEIVAVLYSGRDKMKAQLIYDDLDGKRKNNILCELINMPFNISINEVKLTEDNSNGIDIAIYGVMVRGTLVNDIKNIRR